MYMNPLHPLPYSSLGTHPAAAVKRTNVAATDMMRYGELNADNPASVLWYEFENNYDVMNGKMPQDNIMYAAYHKSSQLPQSQKHFASALTSERLIPYREQTRRFVPGLMSSSVVSPNLIVGREPLNLYTPPKPFSTVPQGLVDYTDMHLPHAFVPMGIHLSS